MLVSLPISLSWNLILQRPVSHTQEFTFRPSLPSVPPHAASISREAAQATLTYSDSASHLDFNLHNHSHCHLLSIYNDAYIWQDILYFVAESCYFVSLELLPPPLTASFCSFISWEKKLRLPFLQGCYGESANRNLWPLPSLCWGNRSPFLGLRGGPPGAGKLGDGLGHVSALERRLCEGENDLISWADIVERPASGPVSSPHLWAILFRARRLLWVKWPCPDHTHNLPH